MAAEIGNEYRLHVVPIDGRIGLQEEPQEEILGEGLIRANHVDPRALPLRIRIELEPLE